MSLPKDNPKSILSQWSSLKKDTPSGDRQVPKSKTTYKASEGQQRLYFLNQLNPQSPVYNLTEIWKLKGDLDIDLFRKALSFVGQRQELLRTVFKLDEDKIYCQLLDRFEYDFAHIDMQLEAGADQSAIEDSFEEIAQEKAHKIFDLSKGPLLSITICQFEKTDFRIIVNVHHIISDKWSMHLMRNELSHSYKLLEENKELDLDPLTQQFSDYVSHQSNQKVDQPTLSYWKEKLKGNFQKVSLPSDKGVRKNLSRKGKYATHEFDKELSLAVKHFCKQHKITSFAFFLTLFKILIHKYNYVNDIVIGTPISTRSKLEFEKIIGFFNDTIVLRTLIAGQMTFETFLHETKKTVLEAFSNKDVGFQNLINELRPDRSFGGNPLFQMMFLYHQNFNDSTFTDDISMEVLNYDMGVSKFDFTLYVAESPDQYEVTIEYATELYSESFIDRFHVHLKELASIVVTNPEILIKDISYLSKTEKAELLTIGKGPAISLDTDLGIIDAIFKNRNPEAIALVDEEVSMTYRELDEVSNQIANTLIIQNSNSVYVGILLEQSTDFIVAMVGILKAGLAYLPLDISYPEKHIKHALKTSSVELLISSSKLSIPEFNNIKTIKLEDLDASITFDQRVIGLDSPAYLIFTSGSTGNPNGVSISHLNLLNSTRARFKYYEKHPDAFLLLSSFSFDSSVAGIYWTLMNGGKIVIPKKQSIQDAELLSKLIENEQISHTLLIPSLYQVYLEYMPSAILEKLKLVILAGEVLPSAVVERHFQSFPHVKLYNEYGPTEASVWSSAYELNATKMLDVIPIGKPIANNKLFVLDEFLKLTPKGIPGELYVAGLSVSNGYLNNTEKTDSKFIEQKIEDEVYRLYKTGDWVKWNNENELIFLGRRDHQIKIRGHRIELGEIDAFIHRFDKDINSVTVYNESQNSLISFIVSNKEIDTNELKNSLISHLPKQYWPDRITQLDHFPLMSNGKVSIKELKKLALKKKEIDRSADKLNTTEELLLNIWKEILQVPDLTIKDNYFESGGDSIQIIRIIAKARKQGVNIVVKDIYNYQTVEALSSIIKNTDQKEIESLTWDYLPISPIQEWFFNTYKTNPDHWLQGYSLNFHKPIDTKKLTSVIKTLIDQFEIFRVGFTNQYNKWFHSSKNYVFEDFIYVDDFKRKINEGLSITKTPLIKFYLHEVESKVVDVQIVMHHLITDAVSWPMIINSLEDLILNLDNASVNSSSYFSWIQKFNQLSTTDVFDPSISFWNAMMDHESNFFSKLNPGIEKNYKTIFRKLSADLTKDLRKETRRVSALKFDEVIIASFLQMFHEHTAENELTIMLEKHGRESEQIDLDLSMSVGWHTTYFPVHFILSDPQSTLNSLIEVKEQLRIVPDNGQSYGALKYLSKKIKSKPRSYVVINHLGHQATLNSKVFKNVDFIREGMRDLEGERDALIEINTSFIDDELNIAFDYDQSQLDPGMMDKWSKDLVEKLESVPSAIRDSSPIKTPSDFNYNYNSHDLSLIEDDVKAKGGSIGSIIDLTAIQSALLFHHLQNKRNDQGLIIASVNLNGQIEKDTMQNAWDKLLEKHDILRSFFMWEGLSKPAIVSCERADYEVEFIEYKGKDDGFDQYVNEWKSQHSNIELDLNGPSIYKLVCFKKSEQLSCLVFVCHHIYIDGWSTSTLFNEFVTVYKQLSKGLSIESSQIPSLKQWKETYTKENLSSGLNGFWEGYLENTTPSLLKSKNSAQAANFKSVTISLNQEESNKLELKLKESRITLNIFFAGIWSWLLSNYTNRSETLIGLTFSGRSLAIDQMDKLIGMFSTVLPLKYKNTNTDELDFVKIQNEFNELLSRDAINLEDLSQNIVSKSNNLFDSLLIVENFMIENQNKSDLYLSGFKSRISSLIPFCIVVIPGKELRISLRYNSSLFDDNEVKLIEEDLTHVIQSINIQGGKANIAYQPKYKVIEEANIVNDAVNSFSFIEESRLDFKDKILAIWKEIFNSSEINTTDNFFEIGGTSLMAVRIFNRINELLHINASPILLLRNNTVERLSNVLSTSDASVSWQCLYPLKEKGDLDPIFCFHAGDGHILFYNDFAKSINSDRPVYGIQPVGLDGNKLTFSSIGEMADFYIQEIKNKYPTGPYHLLGTCFSNAVTFEIAKKLKSEIGSIIIVDSPPPYYKELSKLKKWLNWVVTFNFPKLLEAFNNYFKYSQFKAPKDEQERNLFNTGKQLRDIMSTYSWSPQDIEIVLIRSSENNEDPYKLYHIFNWQELAKGGLTIKTIPGKHIKIFEGESAKKMASITNSILKKYEIE